MKIPAASALVLCFCAISAGAPLAQSLAQRAQWTQNAQQTETPINRGAPQRPYDPLAGRAHLSGGIWDNALGKINSENKDYGEQVSEWQRAVAGATIHSFVFWMAVASSLSLFFSLVFIHWLLRDRGRRLHVSVNILTQIANAYIDARDRALDAIEKHNQLADDYNALAEKMATFERQKAENQRRIRGESQEAIPVALERSSGPAADSVEAARQDTRRVTQVHPESEPQVRQRFANQISALQEKNKTLRASLNEAVAQIEQLKRQHAVTAGG